jgi:chromosome segregation ATPase
MAKNAELELLVNSQAEKITELETTYADLKREKESITASYRRLSDKHKMFTEKAEREKTELVETHMMELARLRGDLDLETRNYTEYRLNVHRRLHELHEIVASSFDKVKARCLPFPGRGAKIEEMIDWVVEEVKTVSATVW